MVPPGRPFCHRALLVLRSAGVGVVASVTDFALLAFLVSAFGAAPRLASVPAALAGVALQFVGNKWLAFRDRSSAWPRQLAAFAAVEALALFANLVLYDLAMRVAPPWAYLPVRLGSTSAVYFGVSLPLWSRVFRAERGWSPREEGA